MDMERVEAAIFAISDALRGIGGMTLAEGFVAVLSYLDAMRARIQRAASEGSAIAGLVGEVCDEHMSMMDAEIADLMESLGHPRTPLDAPALRRVK